MEFDIINSKEAKIEFISSSLNVLDNNCKTLAVFLFFRRIMNFNEYIVNIFKKLGHHTSQKQFYFDRSLRKYKDV